MNKSKNIFYMMIFLTINEILNKNEPIPSHKTFRIIFTFLYKKFIYFFEKFI